MFNKAQYNTINYNSDFGGTAIIPYSNLVICLDVIKRNMLHDDRILKDKVSINLTKDNIILKDSEKINKDKVI